MGARNSEKHMVGLNRFYIDQQQERDRQLKRPPLDNLNDAGEVSKWIPSIQKEIEHFVHQLSGRRGHMYHPDKMKEFEERIDFLKREYKRFVSKVYELNPEQKAVPWTQRSYSLLRKRTANIDSLRSDTTQNSLATSKNTVEPEAIFNLADSTCTSPSSKLAGNIIVSASTKQTTKVAHKPTTDPTDHSSNAGNFLPASFVSRTNSQLKTIASQTNSSTTPTPSPSSTFQSPNNKKRKLIVLRILDEEVKDALSLESVQFGKQDE